MTASRHHRFSRTLAMLLLPGAALAQRGFDWDHPDGLGVRYLLYDRIERSTFQPKSHPPELRALFLPKSKSDWVRIKGTELAWGVHVYEFRDQGGFAKFLAERDPRRTFREFKIDGEPTKEHDGRYFEFVDTWRPFLEVLDRPQPRGPYRYAVSPELGIRFLCDKTMHYVDPFLATDGDNCFARLHPSPNQWIRIDGLPGPVGWMIRMHVFPDLQRERSGSDRGAFSKSFQRFATEDDPRLADYERKFSAKDQAVDGAPYRLWRWRDERKQKKPQTTPFFHTVAAVYQVGEREVALLGFAPANDAEPLPEPMPQLEKMATSLESWSGEAKEPGFAYYNVAASCRVGDREVGIVVYLPIGTEKPDRKLLDIGKKIVNSIEPQPDRR